MDRHPITVALLVYAAFLLLAGSLPSGQTDISIPGYIIFCIATGIMEEGVFCGLIYRCLGRRTDTSTEGLREHSTHLEDHLRAAILTATLFGLAHLSFANGLVLGITKVMQAATFSFCMVGLYKVIHHLIVPMTVHAAFDALYFLPAYVHTHALPPYGALSPDGNIALLAGATLLFVVLTLIMVKFVFMPEGDNADDRNQK